MYTVKQTAKLMGMTEHAVRYYTDKGLVPSVKRDKNNIRIFDDESLNWLGGIKCLRDCGMSIEAIKEYCDLCLAGDSTIERRYQIIAEQKAIAEIKLKEAQKSVAYIKKKEKHYVDIMNQKIPDIMNPVKWPDKSIR